MCVTTTIAILEHFYHHRKKFRMLRYHTPNPLSLNPQQLFSGFDFTNLSSVLIDLALLDISSKWDHVTHSRVSGSFHL